MKAITISQPTANKTLIGVSLSLALPFLFAVFGKHLGFSLWINEIIWWSIGGLVFTYLLVVEKRPLRSAGFKAVGLKELGWGFLLGILLFFLFPLLNVVVSYFGWPVSQEKASIIGSLPVYALFILALRAAVVEDLLFRAYSIERLEELTGNKLLSGALPLLLFVLAHLQWGAGHLLFVTGAGLLLTIFYSWKRNIWINIIGHFLVDFTLFMMIPMMKK
ncbi:hypothetical protein GCM10023189_51680 [Nibrella saemangeumensis]|uniref:CAAX prenyl protease 2/Lysostaphin resistance protein A-like domain-containing protein n=1 Tax=Nibrella saemangeumensis TaxID=1084526 RepID=A0ABP8NHZ5_9BACT